MSPLQVSAFLSPWLQTEEAKNKYGAFFSFLPPLEKKAQKVDPQLFFPPYVLITGLGDPALNAWTFRNARIDPYIWKNPFNVLITGLEDLALIIPHIIGKQSLYLEKL